MKWEKVKNTSLITLLQASNVCIVAILPFAYNIMLLKSSLLRQLRLSLQLRNINPEKRAL